MKKLNLKTTSYRYLEKGFKEWLDIQGYAPGTVQGLPLHVREFLYSLEQAGIDQIRALKSSHLKGHYRQLQQRANQRRGGGLGTAYLNKHLQALKKFTEYLRKTGKMEIPMINTRTEKGEPSILFLSREEIQSLYLSTYLEPAILPNMSGEKLQALQSRDRAMLSVFYGCGLRRNEGVQLDTGDIDLNKGLLHVRKGKNHKERRVPMGKAAQKYLSDYIYDYRPELLRRNKTGALLLNYRGQRMQGQGFLLRLKYLQSLTDSATLREKEIGLHTLRHSIATHLLAQGMKLESISRFLGHSSLESTQIYTHLAGISKEQPYDLLSQKDPYIKLHEDEF